MLTRLQPVLFVADLDAEIAFYLALGFEVQYQEPGFAGLAWADRILFGLQRQDGATFDAAQPLIWQIGTDDIDAVHQRCSQAGLPVIKTPERQGWGEWLMRLRSPNGYQVVIEGQRRDDDP